MSEQNDWITTEEAVNLTGYSGEQIRRLARAGKITSKKFGPVWMISQASLLEYIQSEGRGPQPR